MNEDFNDDELEDEMHEEINLGEFELPETHSAGESVEQTGTYVCSPCGNQERLEAGDTFPTCIACLKTPPASGDKGVWEKAD